MQTAGQALCVKTKCNEAFPPVFTSFLIVLIAPSLLLSGASMQFFPVPLGQSSGQRSNSLHNDYIN